MKGYTISELELPAGGQGVGLSGVYAEDGVARAYHIHIPRPFSEAGPPHRRGSIAATERDQHVADDGVRPATLGADHPQTGSGPVAGSAAVPDGRVFHVGDTCRRRELQRSPVCRQFPLAVDERVEWGVAGAAGLLD